MGRYIVSQTNAWNDETAMIKWFEKLWRPYSFFSIKKQTLLLLDDASSNKTQKVKQSLQESLTNLSTILRRTYKEVTTP